MQSELAQSGTNLRFVDGQLVSVASSNSGSDQTEMRAFVFTGLLGKHAGDFYVCHPYL